MITLTLNGHSEKLSPSSEGDTSESRLLYHQWRTREALHHYDVVINTYNTGTGKTRAALQRLIDLNRTGVNVLFIAPTNELITQHVRDTQAFVEREALDYRVIPARAHDVRALGSDLRSGETLVRLIRNYQEFDEYSTRRQAVVMVTNPDILYYALYFRYGPHDQRNIFEEFVKRFDYIIVDEFHYYNNKQLANFLFALTLFDQFGYFSSPDHQRRVCLLSATPRANVRHYLHNLFGDRMVVIEPSNEPEASADYDTIPTLAPLHLRIVAGNLIDWVRSSGSEIADWVKQGQDGVVISNSLARINRVYAQLALAEGAMSRITGPEPQQSRANAPAAPLILATPTVDLGYNFDKRHKPARQNIDFVVTEARFSDELIQRIGRAGRVLGKQHADVPAQAIVLVSEWAARELRTLDGQILERRVFAERLSQVTALPSKHGLDDYIRTYAVEELLFPITKLNRLMQDQSARDELDALYTRLLTLLSPKSRDRRKSIEGSYRKLEHRESWLNQVEKLPKVSRTPPPDSLEHLADYLGWLDGKGERPDEKGLAPYLNQIWTNSEFRTDWINFVRSRVSVTTALFHFRDAFAGPSAVFFDEKRWFSSEPINTYDVFHLLSHFRLSQPMTRTEFVQRFAKHDPVPEGDFYLQLKAQRETPLTVEFKLVPDLSQQHFDQRWTRIPVALRGLSIQVRERGGDIVSEVAEPIRKALMDEPVMCVVVPVSDERIVRSRLFEAGYWWRNLDVYFGDSLRPERYLIFTGTTALEAHAALKSYFARLQPREEILIY